ncbi:protein SSUH2 homolog [Mastacembelus armatus]|uniref:protein SSUH2 homolog n=1 Tax=Mastacembelus armatus TaxID=205130 RepID=UPI000E46270A|nr:protein SSUH2 homolog [Mastacembelus armatus]
MNSAAMYPPVSGPAPNMFGSVPGYQGPTAGAAVYHPLSAPTANIFGSVPGYEAGAGGYIPPPMPMQPTAPLEPGSTPDNWSIPALSEDDARKAFQSFASSHCCYSSSPADNGVITKMEPFNTYRYRLETFTESRSTEWAHKPYEGETPDCNTQPAPQPWEIAATPPKLFTKQTQELRVPFTSSIKDCNTCLATGKVKCEDCKGNGYKSCTMCNGSGRRNEESCTQCEAAGKKKCSVCNGEGMKACDTCKGKRRLLAFIQVKVEWTNHVDDHIVEQNSGLKAEELRSANGKELFKNSQYLLYPLLGFPNPAISEASERLIKEHQSKYAQTSRILQQRQTVDLIPITKVAYKWKEAFHSYVVYGTNNQVSANDYPATCCCVIL